MSSSVFSLWIQTSTAITDLGCCLEAMEDIGWLEVRTGVVPDGTVDARLQHSPYRLFLVDGAIKDS
jgi:hypothetical protein